MNFLDAALVNKRTLVYTRSTPRCDRRIETRSQHDTIVSSTRIRTLEPETTRVRGNTKPRWSSSQRRDYRSIKNKNIALGYIIAIFDYLSVSSLSSISDLSCWTSRYILDDTRWRYSQRYWSRAFTLIRGSRVPCTRIYINNTRWEPWSPGETSAFVVRPIFNQDISVFHVNYKSARKCGTRENWLVPR